VMPNHLHGIILLVPTVGAYYDTPRRDNPSQKPLFVSPSRTFGAIIRGFKSATTVQTDRLRDTPRSPLWQRNYYEHIVRDIDNLNRIRNYIRNTPLQWSSDNENPINVTTTNTKSITKKE
jgi:putative transposase